MKRNREGEKEGKIMMWAERNKEKWRKGEMRGKERVKKTEKRRRLGRNYSHSLIGREREKEIWMAIDTK